MDYNKFNQKFPLPDSMNMEFSKFDVKSLTEKKEKPEMEDKDDKDDKKDVINGKSKKTKVEINPPLEDIQEV